MLQVRLTYNFLLVVFYHRFNAVVDQGLQPVSVARNMEFWSPVLEGGGREEDVLRERENAVVLGFPGSCVGFLDLFLHTLHGLEKVDLAV